VVVQKAERESHMAHRARLFFLDWALQKNTQNCACAVYEYFFCQWFCKAETMMFDAQKYVAYVEIRR